MFQKPKLNRNNITFRTSCESSDRNDYSDVSEALKVSKVIVNSMEKINKI